MKLSHLLIAALVSSSVMATAQTGPKTKKQKVKPKTEKKDKLPLCVDRVYIDTTSFHPKFNCPACGRG